MADPTPVSDDQIIDMIRRGERQGVMFLLERYGRLIVSIAIKKHGISREDAEELRTDIILELVKKIESFDKTKGSFRTWVSRIAQRRAIDRYRKEMKKQADCTMPEEWWSMQSQDDHATNRFGNTQIDHALQTRIKSALSKLNDRDNELLRLRAEGHTPDEIAILLGIEKNASNVAYCRAKQRLEYHLGDMTVPTECSSSGA
jgi:RNA polymerase sigma-70 factor, ECF subfamily